MIIKTTRYACRNPECRWSGQARVIAWKSLGNGLAQEPGRIYCECDYAVEAEKLPDLVAV